MDFINGRFYPKLMGRYNFGDGDRCSWGGNALIGLDWGWGKPWTLRVFNDAICYIFRLLQHARPNQGQHKGKHIGQYLKQL